jgi:hypothetical protein
MPFLCAGDATRVEQAISKHTKPSPLSVAGASSLARRMPSSTGCIISGRPIVSSAHGLRVLPGGGLLNPLPNILRNNFQAGGCGYERS